MENTRLIESQLGIEARVCKHLVGANDCALVLSKSGERRGETKSALPVVASHVREKSVYLLLFHRMGIIRSSGK